LPSGVSERVDAAVADETPQAWRSVSRPAL
jgi:hypothetical protein